MKAIVITQPGGPEVLQLRDVPDAVPAPGEVLIRVAATALNGADKMQRQGKYAPPPGASAILGLECSGTIEQLGEGVEGLNVGDEASPDCMRCTSVCALLAGGGYAEKVNVPAGQVLPRPTNVPLVEAAGLPEVACTVWSTIFEMSRLKRGETLLIHGGSSGVGTFAVQLAVALGCRVLITAGSKVKIEAVKKLGAEVGINYKEEDFVQVCKEVTNGQGVDVVLDHIGGPYLANNLDVLAKDGRLFCLYFAGGSKAELDLTPVFKKRLTIQWLRARPLDQKARIVSEVRKNVWPLIESGQIKPVIDCILPLTEAAKAHEHLESSAHIGKIVLPPPSALPPPAAATAAARRSARRVPLRATRLGARATAPLLKRAAAAPRLSPCPISLQPSGAPGAATMGKGADRDGAVTVCGVLLAILLPPLGVFVKRECHIEFWICVLLTILGYIPGIIYALYSVLEKNSTANWV
eukprot:SM000100S09458  [mRNA]  locus=s100:392804:402348:- [translate_table: standard]